jgi:hypothetical protein
MRLMEFEPGGYTSCHSHLENIKYISWRATPFLWTHREMNIAFHPGIPFIVRPINRIRSEMQATL